MKETIVKVFYYTVAMISFLLLFNAFGVYGCTYAVLWFIEAMSGYSGNLDIAGSERARCC